MNSKTIIEKIAAKLGMKDFKFEEEVIMGELTLESGDTVYVADILDLGVIVYDDIEMTKTITDGLYVLADGTKFEITDGVVGSIEKPEEEIVDTPVEEAEVAPEEAEEAEVTPEEEIIQAKAVETIDGIILYYDPSLELAIDTKLFSDEKLTEPASENEYSTVDGLIITLKNGIVTNIETVMDAYNRLKSIIIDVEDVKTEFSALVSKNESLIKQINELKKEKVNAPANESLNFSEIITESGEKTKLSRSQVKESLNKIFNK